MAHIRLILIYDAHTLFFPCETNVDRKSKFGIPDVVVAYPGLTLHVFLCEHIHPLHHPAQNREKLSLNGRNVLRRASGRPNEKNPYLLLLGFPLTFPKHPMTDVLV